LTEFCIEKKQQQILNIIRQRGNGGYCSKWRMIYGIGEIVRKK
jgi:hypothetical protein